jgi:phage host-nuclease inhibitor protein Gam
MARYKPQVGKIKDLDDANLALKEMGILERELEGIDAEAQKQCGAIKEKAAKEGEPIRDRILELSTALGAFTEYNKADIFPKDRKTIELTFGVIGFRQTTSIHVKKSTLELLQKLNLQRFIRVKEEPDKEAMRELTDEALAQVDAVRKVKDDFFAEPNREEVNKDLLKRSA